MLLARAVMMLSSKAATILFGEGSREAVVKDSKGGVAEGGKGDGSH